MALNLPATPIINAKEETLCRTQDAHRGKPGAGCRKGSWLFYLSLIHIYMNVPIQSNSITYGKSATYSVSGRGNTCLLYTSRCV